MGVSVYSGRSTVDVSGSVDTGVPTVINAYHVSDGSEKTIYTVPANKRFILMGVSAYGSGYLYAYDNATNQLFGITSLSPALVQGGYIAEFSAGQNVKVKAENTAKTNIWGLLLDA